jgi:hypothetical protein
MTAFKKLDNIIEKDDKIISKYCDNLVALYNIRDKKPFYYMSATEARMAMSYIQQLREDQMMELDFDNFIHQIAKDFINNYNEWDFLKEEFMKNNILSGEKLDSYDFETFSESLYEIDVFYFDKKDKKISEIFNFINEISLNECENKPLMIIGNTIDLQEYCPKDKLILPSFSHEKLLKDILYLFGSVRIIGNSDVPPDFFVGVFAAENNYDKVPNYLRVIIVKT